MKEEIAMIKDVLIDLDLDNEKYLVVGCSAGPDSMALLHYLKNNTKIEIVCAHINHNVRKESLKEEQYLKKFCKDHEIIFESVTFKRLSFKTTIKSSTLFFSLSIPFEALKLRAFPSNKNGFVTIPTVSIPISFAISATIGAAPVPVPPPIPAVINTKSAPDNICFISSLFSIDIATISAIKTLTTKSCTESCPTSLLPIILNINATNCIK